MAFQDMAEQLNKACIDCFGTTANLFPQSAPDTAVPIQGIFEKPSSLEEVMPGFGVDVARLFVGFLDITPTPQEGDIVTINGSSYDLYNLNVDAVGGATLKLRKRSNVANKRTLHGTARIA